MQNSRHSRLSSLKARTQSVRDIPGSRYAAANSHVNGLFLATRPLKCAWCWRKSGHLIECGVVGVLTETLRVDGVLDVKMDPNSAPDSATNDSFYEQEWWISYQPGCGGRDPRACGRL